MIEYEKNHLLTAQMQMKNISSFFGQPVIILLCGVQTNGGKKIIFCSQTVLTGGSKQQHLNLTTTKPVTPGK